ncbi:hypothetical protein SLEP1_g15153 [Rubroshorea leprosula]|uniref:Uncharacterized protein n=1 Tax=Rubroshorea leprosula TaxID=152421 RepID=A0AAV5IWX4_9ROSI|nr:hypothetical protein SLEP1_g15153 [Rubroshorea leprosula]
MVASIDSNNLSPRLRNHLLPLTTASPFALDPRVLLFFFFPATGKETQPSRQHSLEKTGKSLGISPSFLALEHI